MTIYQLVATGERAFTGEKSKLHSRKVFTAEADAHAFKPEFEKLCTADLGGYDFNRMSVVYCIQIAELDLSYMTGNGK